MFNICYLGQILAAKNVTVDHKSNIDICIEFTGKSTIGYNFGNSQIFYVIGVSSIPLTVGFKISVTTHI